MEKIITEEIIEDFIKQFQEETESWYRKQELRFAEMEKLLHKIKTDLGMYEK